MDRRVPRTGGETGHAGRCPVRGWNTGLFVHRHVRAVGLDQLVAHFHDVVDRELGGRVWVEHRGAVNVLAFARARGLDRHELHVDVCHVHRGELHRQAADVAGIDAHPVDQARHLDARVGGQVVDQARVQHIAADLVRHAGEDGLHDVRGVFLGARMADLAVLQNRGLFFLPALDLVDAAARVLVERDVVRIDQLRVSGFDEQRVVFGVVLARLGAVIAEAADILVAHHILVLFRGVFLRGTAADLGIQVVAVPVRDLQEPRHVVDAGDELAAALELILHAETLQQVARAGLHAVAEADGLHIRVALHIAGEHRHRVRVVEEPRVGADRLDVAGEVLEHRYRAQGAHDAADAERVGDRLAQAVLLRDLEVDDGAGLVEADLDRVDDKVCAAQRLPAVFNAAVGLERGPVLVCVVVDGAEDDVGLLKAFRVDVVKCDFAFAERGRAHAVAEHIARKDRAAGAHKGDFWHSDSILSPKRS